MMKKNKESVWLGTSILSFFLMSVSFLLMPTENKYLQLIAGLMFWVFMVLGVVSQVILAMLAKRLSSKNREKRMQKQRVGIFEVCKNKFALVADIVFLLCVVVFAVLMIFTNGSSYFCYIVLTMLVFSFCMHCVLNGKIFTSICEQNKKDKGKVKQNDK